MLIKRQTCRVCGSDKLSPILNLGAQALASNFMMDDRFPPTERKIPLELVRCDPERDEKACGLVQLCHTVPGNLMYSSYGYRSGINDTMRRHLHGIAQYAESIAAPNHPHAWYVVDVGANDGTLLAGYSNSNESVPPRYVGFEPSNILPTMAAQLKKDVKFVRGFFPNDLTDEYGHPMFNGNIRILTSIAMFYDLENPVTFAKGVADNLAKNGVWIFEMSYLPKMLENASFDTICHEHLEYYSLAVIRHILDEAGLAVFDASLNDANGESIRVTAAHAPYVREKITDDARARIYALDRAEFDLQLDTAEPYHAFARKVWDIKNELGQLLLKLRGEGKKIYGYGASTKGNVILQFCGITPAHVTAIADRNPDKVGGKTIGSDIPIVSEEEMRAAKPDYLLVLPWHFMKEFRQREEAFVGRGGKFIVPVPKVEVL